MVFTIFKDDLKQVLKLLMAKTTTSTKMVVFILDGCMSMVKIITIQPMELWLQDHKSLMEIIISSMEMVVKLLDGEMMELLITSMM